MTHHDLEQVSSWWQLVAGCGTIAVEVWEAHRTVGYAWGAVQTQCVALCGAEACT